MDHDPNNQNLPPYRYKATGSSAAASSQRPVRPPPPPYRSKLKGPQTFYSRGGFANKNSAARGGGTGHRYQYNRSLSKSYTKYFRNRTLSNQNPQYENEQQEQSPQSLDSPLKYDQTPIKTMNVSAEETKQLTSIIIKGIHVDNNTREHLTDILSQYGAVKRIMCNLKKEYATIKFLDHSSARRAKNDADSFFPGYPPVMVNFAKSTKALDSVKKPTRHSKEPENDPQTPISSPRFQSDNYDEYRQFTDERSQLEKEDMFEDRPEKQPLDTNISLFGKPPQQVSTSNNNSKTSIFNLPKENSKVPVATTPSKTSIFNLPATDGASNFSTSQPSIFNLQARPNSFNLNATNASQTLGSGIQSAFNPLAQANFQTPPTTTAPSIFNPQANPSIFNLNSQVDQTDNSDAYSNEELEDGELANTDNCDYELRCQILEKRDKELREKNKRPEGPDYTDSIIVGTCPDMCPEKERYSRISKRFYSFLEVKDGEVDQKSMIKIYVRSSADQQEPLPHELRPASTLKLTMDYIVCNLLNRTDIAKSDWFHFIWDRTRAIRKDITLQHTCDLETVNVVEMCARFHIHCAFALSSEDRQNFDPKINYDNLAECFQSLRQLYKDLSSKGILCPNEHEFKAYDMFMNLSNGSIFTKLQWLSPQVHSSYEVNFAIQVIKSYCSNNYVKFFKLARQASYLSGCLLHRYFNQIRYNGFMIMLKAYSRPNLAESFSFQYLANIFCFENVEHVKKFCASLGMKMDENNAIFDRSFEKNETLLNQISDFGLIESKMTKSIAEVVYNGLLPPNPYNTYKPQDSFMEDNILKPAATSSVNIFSTSGSNFQESSFRALQNVPPHSLFRTQLPPPKPRISFRALTDLCSSLVGNVTDKYVAKAAQQQYVISKISENVYTEILANIINKASFDTLTKEEARSKQKQKLASEYLDHLLSKTTHTMVSTIIKKEFIEPQKEYLNCLANQILDNMVQQQSSFVCQSILNEESAKHWQRKQALERKRIFHLSTKYFYRWFNTYQKRKNRRLALQRLPSDPFYRVRRFPSAGPLPHSQSILDVVRERKSVDLLLDSHLEAHKIKVQESRKGLNLAELVPPFTFFKIVICFGEGSNHSRFKQWICNKLSRQPVTLHDTRTEILDLYRAPNMTYVCVKLVNGIPLANDLLGASLIFFVQDIQNMNYLNQARHCLQELFPTPADCCFTFDPHIEAENGVLMRDIPLKDSLILNKVLQCISPNLPPALRVKTETLRNFIEESLCKYVFNPCDKFRDMELSPILELYSNCLEHLKNVITSNNSIQYLTWPAPEFTDLTMADSHPLPTPNWNHPNRLKCILDMVDQFKLPSSLVHCTAVNTFVETFNRHPALRSHSFYFKTNSLVEKASKKRKYGIPWGQILFDCAFVLINSLSWTDDSNNPILVYYFEDDYHKFDVPQQWKDAVTNRPKYKRNFYRTEDIPKDLDATLKSVLDKSLEETTYSSPLVKEINELREKEIRESNEMSNYMKRLLQEGEENIAALQSAKNHRL